MTHIHPSIFLKDDPVWLAQYFLGKKLKTTLNGIQTAGIITETEAYRAPDDKACHAYKNRRTKRTETMFKEGGHAYVYLCYGIHHLFNIVTGPKDVAHAVLVRALYPLEGIPAMLERRNMQKAKPNLCAGPGTLSQALGIRTAMDGISFSEKKSPIQIEDTTISIAEHEIQRTARIGVGYAEECAEWPWRFVIRQDLVAKKLSKEPSA